MRKQVLFSVMLTLGVMGGLTMCPTPAMASIQQSQTIKVGGQVVDQEGEPLIGATIRLKGSENGVITDLDGNFQLDAPANATLVVSYVGYYPFPHPVSESGYRTASAPQRLPFDLTA